MFTAKHYEVVAKILGNYQTREQLVDDFVDLFARDNQRFDSERFREAIVAYS